LRKLIIFVWKTSFWIFARWIFNDTYLQLTSYWFGYLTKLDRFVKNVLNIMSIYFRLAFCQYSNERRDLNLRACKKWWSYIEGKGILMLQMLQSVFNVCIGLVFVVGRECKSVSVFVWYVYKIKKIEESK